MHQRKPSSHSLKMSRLFPSCSIWARKKTESGTANLRSLSALRVASSFPPDVSNGNAPNLARRNFSIRGSIRHGIRSAKRVTGRRHLGGRMWRVKAHLVGTCGLSCNTSSKKPLNFVRRFKGPVLLAANQGFDPRTCGI
jgi:hypothetical protein